MDLLQRISAYCRESGIEELLRRSNKVVVGFSGGADSRLLLSYFAELKGSCPTLFVAAAHVNHMIRGEEAMRDEEFCKRVCLEAGIPLEIERRDVPALARERRETVEEAARNVRYSFFASLREKYPDALVATAHNADDNLETVLFNMARGSGVRGLCGIAPVRDGWLIRPLLCLTSAEIRSYAAQVGMEYVVDSTNADTAYTRNSIRHGALPVLRSVNENAAMSALRLSALAREDCDFIEKEALALLEKGRPDPDTLRDLHPALFARVVRILYERERGSAESLSEKNIRDCRALLLSEGGRHVSLPGELAFFADRDCVYVGRDPRFSEKKDTASFRIPLTEEKAEKIGDFIVFMSRNEVTEPQPWENIYNLSLHCRVDCDKINGSLFMRGRNGGDTLRAGGMNKKLKKLLCDNKVPLRLRDGLPLVCDGDGILFVPYVGLRDGAGAGEKAKNAVNLYIYKRSVL